jgi:hypothetical protein
MLKEKLLGRTEYMQGLSLDGTMEAHGNQLSTRMNHEQGSRSFNNITILLMPCVYLYKFFPFLFTSCWCSCWVSSPAYPNVLGTKRLCYVLLINNMLSSGIQK